MSDLERVILILIRYYDIFDYPLTVMEVWGWGYKLDVGCRMLDVLGGLRRLGRGGKIEEKAGFYFLKGREGLVSLRQRKRNWGIKKWKKAMRAVKVLRFVPFVRMIALCNNNGFLNTKEESDIDLFIIVKSGQIWLTRFLITLVVQVLGMRRQGDKIKDRICLSFYITDGALNIRKFYDKNNMYLYQWMNLVAPIFDVGGVYKKFFCENKWIREFLPRAEEWWLPESAVVAEGRGVRWVRGGLEKILSGRLGRLGNGIFKKIQLRRMAGRKDSAIFEDNDKVVVNDFVLKFHERALPSYEPDSFVCEV